jgi:phosphoglycerate dehydrogenase-like enzyme
MEQTLLLITRDDERRAYEEHLRALNLAGLEILAPKSERELRDNLERATIMLAHPGLARRYINEAGSLRWVQSTFAGVDALIAPDLRTDYILTNVKETYGAVMAEWVFTYILFFEREVRENLEAQAARIWAHHPYGSVAEKTLAIIGTGSIGRHIARVAQAFGMKTIGLNTSGAPADGFDETFGPNERRNFLQRGDYVVSVLPSTPETRGCLNRALLEDLKPGVVLMNLGRGDAVVEEDLLIVLRQRQIKAVVLDVFSVEPLPKDSPLWDEPNLYLTPHVSGYSISQEIFRIFADNYRRFMAGNQLRYLVDFKRGY